MFFFIEKSIWLLSNITVNNKRLLRQNCKALQFLSFIYTLLCDCGCVTSVLQAIHVHLWQITRIKLLFDCQAVSAVFQVKPNVVLARLCVNVLLIHLQQVNSTASLAIPQASASGLISCGPLSMSVSADCHLRLLDHSDCFFCAPEDSFRITDCFI